MALDGVDVSVSCVPNSRNPCKKCKTIAQSGLKCVSCGTVSHAGCIKQMKTIKVIDDKTIVCCATTDRSVTGGGAQKLPVAVEGGAVSNSIIDVYYLKQIVEQKDEIIRNQKDLIESLKQQIVLMKCSRTVIDTTNSPSSCMGSNVDNKAVSYAGVSAAGYHKPGGSSRVKSGPSTSGETNKMGGSEDSTVFSELQNHKAVTAAKFAEIINLVDDTSGHQITTKFHKSSKDVVAPNPHKYQRKGKRSSPQVVGERTVDRNDEVDIRAAVTYRFFHVTKLDPKTTAEDLKRFLQTDLPEVRVDKLESLHPDCYSSFKIGISEKNETKVLDPSFWPSGSRVKRFFHARKKSPRSAE